jgi:hypothetical protein
MATFLSILASLMAISSILQAVAGWMYDADLDDLDADEVV